MWHLYAHCLDSRALFVLVKTGLMKIKFLPGSNCISVGPRLILCSGERWFSTWIIRYKLSIAWGVLLSDKQHFLKFSSTPFSGRLILVLLYGWLLETFGTELGDFLNANYCSSELTDNGWDDCAYVGRTLTGTRRLSVKISRCCTIKMPDVRVILTGYEQVRTKLHECLAEFAG
jgi:hypothetical protein